jgi:glycosyltransferase involved in cell wall biosynthesis
MEKRWEGRNGVDVSVVFPAYNERENLENAVSKTVKVLQGIAGSYEIIIAEDGSTDGTDLLAARLASESTFVKHIHRSKRLGRGLALKNAFTKSKGKILIYMDVDLATDIEQLGALIEAIRSGYDFATGSRMLSASKVERSMSRQLTSKSFNFMARTFLRSKVADHQCGFKAAKREALLKVLDEVKATHWFWDTETLVRAQHRGYRVKEIPIEWRESGRTKVKLMNDSFSMGRQILRLWWELRKEPAVKALPENSKTRHVTIARSC